MSGYNDNVTSDACYERFENEVNDGTYNYQMNPRFWTRENTTALHHGVVSGRENYGRKTPRTITSESFLQGRGQVSSVCPESEVIYLPSSQFPADGTVGTFDTATAARATGAGNAQRQETPAISCSSTKLERLLTRVPKSANSLSEADVSERNMFPGGYQNGYQGYNAVVDTHIQTRMHTLAPPVNERGVQTSYATYGLNEASGRYGLGSRLPKYEHV